MRARDWGYVEQCPFCDKTNIKRKHPGQVTSGDPECMEKQKEKSRQEAAEKRRRKSNREVA